MNVMLAQAFVTLRPSWLLFSSAIIFSVPSFHQPLGAGCLVLVAKPHD
jgi:hypothetical protein